MISCLAITAQPWFVDRSDARVGYGQSTAGTLCDVVLYGDSTAMFGLNPAIVEKETGLKACNISEPGSVGTFVGKYAPLDDYLAHIPPPKYLVTSWGFTSFDLDREPRFVNEAAGFEYAWRYRQGISLWKHMALDPVDTLPLLAYEESYVIATPFHSIYQAHFTKRNDRAFRMSHGGWMNWAYERQAGPDGCASAAKGQIASPYEINREGVEAFRKRYEAKGIKVVIDVSPVAECAPNLETAMDSIRGLHDNRFETLPVKYFYGDDIHLSADGAARYSEEVADQILALMRSDGLKTPQSSTSQTDRIKQ